MLITSGMHGREWGGPDICIYFAADLLEAYTLGTDLTYGGKTFSASVVRHIVERVHVVVFPCVNPDGVRYSHANPSASWRKNRNPESSVSTNLRSVGVDVCRNFDFVWDYRSAFAPAAIWSGLASDDPGQHAAAVSAKRVGVHVRGEPQVPAERDGDRHEDERGEKRA